MQKTQLKRYVIECLFCGDECLEQFGHRFGIKISCCLCSPCIIHDTCELCSFREAALHRRSYVTKCHGEWMGVN